MRHAWKRQLTELAAQVDAGYPDNADLVISDGHPVLKRRAGKDRRAAALTLESAVHQRLPQRELLAILTRTGYQTGWPHLRHHPHPWRHRPGRRRRHARPRPPRHRRLYARPSAADRERAIDLLPYDR